MIDVSVIIPTYNATSKFLAALDSVLSHKDLIIQIVVVEDGSKNPSRAWLESHYREYLDADNSLTNSSIKYLRQSNKGAYIARIVGSEKSDGKYIKFLDQDDVLLPNTLNEEVAAFDPSVDVILSDWEVIGTTKDGPDVCKLHKAPTLSNPINDFLRHGGVYTSAALYRAELLKNVLKPVPSFCPIKADDWLIFAQICLGGARYKTINNIAYVWSQHPNQLSRLTRNELIDEHYEILNWIEVKLNTTGTLTDERKKLLANYYAKQLLEAYNQNKNMYERLVCKIKSLDSNYKQSHGGVLFRIFCLSLGLQRGIKYYSSIKHFVLKYFK